MSKLIIIVPVFNRIEITKKFIECLNKQTYRNFIVWLFDDGNDGTYKMALNNLFDKCMVCKCKDLYWGGALRKAYDLLQNYKENHCIMLANDDLIFDDNYLESGIKVKDDELFSTTVCEGDEIIDGGINVDWKNYKFKVGTPIQCASTRGLFLTLNTWKKIGNINRFLPMHGDYDFTLRAIKRGIQIKTPMNLIALSTDIPEKQKKRRSVFSKLHCMNPFHHTIIILNHCPLKYLPLNLARIWGSAFWKTIKSFFPHESEKWDGAYPVMFPFP